MWRSSDAFEFSARYRSSTAWAFLSISSSKSFLTTLTGFFCVYFFSESEFGCTGFTSLSSWLDWVVSYEIKTGCKIC
jgi:hypothetical protein